MKKIHHTEINARNIESWLTDSKKQMEFYFSINSVEFDEVPSWEYRGIANRINGNIQYTIAGHGIGSNTTEMKSIGELREALLRDNIRFNNGGTLYAQLQPV